MFFCGGRKLFKKSFSSPIPPSFKNFETGVLFFYHNFCAQRLNSLCSHYTTRGSLREGAPDGVGWRRVRNCGFCTFFRRNYVISTARRLLPSRTRRDTFLSEEGSLLVLSPKTVENVILSGENDTVCHFRSRTRP
jgi:hypothetical protein